MKKCRDPNEPLARFFERVRFPGDQAHCGGVGGLARQISE
jgi:hypothetical protein